MPCMGLIFKTGPVIASEVRPEGLNNKVAPNCSLEQKHNSSVSISGIVLVGFIYFR